MRLIDSNIIIYAVQPEYANLRQFIAEHICTCALSDFYEQGMTLRDVTVEGV